MTGDDYVKSIDVYGAPELVALELDPMSRARGIKMETPTVRP